MLRFLFDPNQQVLCEISLDSSRGLLERQKNKKQNHPNQKEHQ
jgi:hypothetical protein